MSDWIVSLREFFESGGPVLFCIFLLSILLWVLIVERYWYFNVGFQKKHNAIIKTWQQRRDQSSWFAMKLREGLLSEIAIASQHNLIPIQTIIGVLPLLGLLGTVTGMISIFEVINIFGTGNARGMADGISRALLPTTAGLVTSIAGLYFSTDLKQRARSRTDQARDHLTHH
ncbi:MAG: MotA/TolQ/ExbB proton channel family protein [Thiotrichales bacterium]|nr:MotA/TolQ/ExbB proton channel family protein [Thiotrichales bacterium]